MTHTVAVHAGSSLTFTTIDSGFALFESGVFHAAFTEDHQFDQAASNATVNVQFDASCNTTNLDNGHAVFTAPSISKDGSYSISTNGVGFIDTGNGSLVFVVGGGTVGQCIKGGAIISYPTTVLMHGLTDVEAPVGTAIFHGTSVICH